MKRLKRALHTTKGERGQALPIAIGALALGVLLVSPLLLGASGGSQATGQIGRQALDRYSLDAGVEWSGWRLISNPTLTTVTTYTSAPLAPFPATINGASFPQTEIRFVTGAGAVEAAASSWQSGGGDKCYTVSASDAGTLSARINVDAGQVWAQLLSSSASCALVGSPAALGSAPQAGADFAVAAAGTYKLLIRTNTATTGSISLSVPAATYEVRSTNGTRSVVARLVAGYSGLRVASWQLN